MKTIGLLPMSNFDFKKLREQCQATGEALRKTFKASDTQLQAFTEKSADPEHLKTLQEKGKKLKDIRGESWKHNHDKAMKNLANDPNWRELQQQGSLARSQKEEWKENHNLGIELRSNNENWLKNKALAKMKPCVTPLGIFRSCKDAGEEYNKTRNVTNGKNAVYNRLKKNTEGYKYITIEEYIMLTGKDL